MITSSWHPPDEQVDAFLQEFERRGLDPGADDGNQFADAFVASAPSGSTLLSRAAMVAALPQRRRMFEAAGVGAARCVDAAQLEGRLQILAYLNHRDVAALLAGR